MNIIQGFVGIPSLVNNSVGVVAPFGELSQHSMSFTRDLRQYSDKTAYPQIELYTLKAINEHNVDIEIPQDIVGKLLVIANWVYTQYDTSSIPVNRSKKTLEQAILTEFNYTRKVQINEIMSTQLASKRLIDRLSFNIETDNDIYQVSLWFNDSRFRTQYRYYHIEVIPPVDDLDRLVGDLADVAVSLNAVKTQAITNRINQYNLRHKLTNVLTMNLVWQDRKNPKAKLNTEWTLLIHGNAGSDTDAMKSAIRDYLAANSNHEEWLKIFPELFSSEEFIIIPLWDKLATPDTTFDDGQYRSLTSLGEIQELRNKYTPNNYRFGQNSEMFLSLNTEVVSVFYRAMLVVSIGNPANKDNIFKLSQIFPDYQSVNTESVDFARMSVKTQNFVLKLNEVMNKARVYDPNRGLPEGLTLSNKGAREYLGFDYEGFTYYVMTRMGYLREI